MSQFYEEPHIQILTVALHSSMICHAMPKTLLPLSPSIIISATVFIAE